jgi:hypothetical protein
MNKYPTSLAQHRHSSQNASQHCSCCRALRTSARREQHIFVFQQNKNEKYHLYPIHYTEFLVASVIFQLPINPQVFFNYKSIPKSLRIDSFGRSRQRTMSYATIQGNNSLQEWNNINKTNVVLMNNDE